jgi:hypothetical protein
MLARDKTPLPDVQIARAIFDLRGLRIILDRDLAALYGVTTKRLNEAVKRNAARFPDDFMFRLTPDEDSSLRSQSATSKTPRAEGRGGARYLPFAFTEHGAIQVANVLNSSRAVDMGVHVVRAFIRLREFLASNRELETKLIELERKYKGHDTAITAMLSTLRQLMNADVRKRRGIGFTADLA